MKKPRFTKEIANLCAEALFMLAEEPIKLSPKQKRKYQKILFGEKKRKTRKS